jgi:N-acetylmuramoyl-L-alanine amidase
MGANKHVFILKKDIELDQNTAYLPFSNLDTINLSETPEYTKIVLPLQQRLPYQIEQDVQANRMILRLYGAKSNIDWITEAPKKDQISTVDHITWNQVQDGVLEITAHLDVSQQWGYWCEYEDTKLNFYIRKAPKLPGTDLAMQGLTVCIDPGHGGEETGSIGPSGVHESTINLAIAQNLAKLLSDNGAKVILTRTTDDINPSLDERVKIAVSSKANILISVHNNALPDNRDPWAERGTSTYWYHPQAVKLAKLIRENVAQSTGFPDYGTYYQNLALCRPSELVSVLVEVGFMINPDEYAQLLKPETQQSAAQGIYNGIYSYLTLMH